MIHSAALCALGGKKELGLLRALCVLASLRDSGAGIARRLKDAKSAEKNLDRPATDGSDCTDEDGHVQLVICQLSFVSCWSAAEIPTGRGQLPRRDREDRRLGRGSQRTFIGDAPSENA
jgi:hypothetical protein